MGITAFISYLLTVFYHLLQHSASQITATNAKMLTDYYGLDKYEFTGGANLSLDIIGYLHEINMDYLNEEEKAQYGNLDLMVAYEGVTDITDKNNPATEFTMSLYSEKLDLDVNQLVGVSSSKIFLIKI